MKGAIGMGLINGTSATIEFDSEFKGVDDVELILEETGTNADVFDGLKIDGCFE